MVEVTITSRCSLLNQRQFPWGRELGHPYVDQRQEKTDKYFPSSRKAGLIYLSVDLLNVESGDRIGNGCRNVP
jgi:hypothetical protein